MRAAKSPACSIPTQVLHCRTCTTGKEPTRHPLLQEPIIIPGYGTAWSFSGFDFLCIHGAGYMIRSLVHIYLPAFNKLRDHLSKPLFNVLWGGTNTG